MPETGVSREGGPKFGGVLHDEPGADFVEGNHLLGLGLGLRLRLRLELGSGLRLGLRMGLGLG